MMTYTCPKCGNPMYCVSTASIPAYIRYECGCGYSSKTIREPINSMPLPEEWRQKEEKPCNSCQEFDCHGCKYKKEDAN